MDHRIYCEICQEPIPPKRLARNSTICSQPCYLKRYQRRRALERLGPRPTNCQQCGEVLPTVGRRRAFCSPQCADSSYRIRNRAQRTAYNREWNHRNPERRRAIERASAERRRDYTNERQRQRGAEGAYARSWKRISERRGPEVAAQNRATKLRRTYNMTTEQYDAMLDAQDGACAICAKTPEQNGRRLAIDHDHACCPGRKTCGKCVRGLLCRECNQRLGIIEDDAWMARAQSYISEPRARLEAT